MPRFGRLTAAGLFAAIGVGQAGAIDIVLDYTYDTQGFFDNSVFLSDGWYARATLEKAASDLSMLLDDSFSPIVVPGDYVSDADGQASPVLYTWDWDINFSNPGVSGGPEVTIVEPTFAADEYRIFAGGRSIGGTTLGVGGPGGASYSAGGSWYFPSEKAEIDAISDAFENQRNRGQASGFSSWGGAITFDNDASTTWNYDWRSNPSGRSDLYSVALHELVHALGIGSSEWDALISGGFFTGAASTAANGGSQVQLSADLGHWIDGTMSTILKGSDPQEAAMDPSITQGTRKLLTDLDAAGLQDIGWEINPAFTYVPAMISDPSGDGDIDDSDLGIAFANYTGPVGAAGGKTLADGDMDGDGDVDDSDLGTLFAGYTGPFAPSTVPEPTSAALLALGGLMAMRRRRD